MTDRKTEMIRLHCEGVSFADIAQRFGVSRKCVFNILCPGHRQEKRVCEYVFPNIAQWMNDNGASLATLSDSTGFSDATISGYLRGTVSPSYAFILAMLCLTGMTFEEAFRRKDE